LGGEPPAKTGGKYSFEIIHSFCTIRDKSNACVDGEDPVVGGVVVKDGVLYGATQNGGGGYSYATPCCYQTGLGNGIIYSMTPPAKSGESWTFKVLHELVDYNHNGSDAPSYDVHQPSGPPVFSSAGALVLPTLAGGAFDVTKANPYGYPIQGGVISIDLPGGGFSIVNNAFGSDQGPLRAGPWLPYGPLSLGTNGDYYGASGYITATDGQRQGNTIYQVIP